MVRIHHCTSEPFRFFGRSAELALLDRALAGDRPSVIALVGPGGQGKTAIVQHWVKSLLAWPPLSGGGEGRGEGFPTPPLPSGGEGRGEEFPTPPLPCGGEGRGEGAGVSNIRDPSLVAHLFFWSFYRGKDADLCLREMYGSAIGADRLPDVAASYAVDHLLEILRNERWAVILDGTEVVQHETGGWRGRFVHPELGRLIEELACEPMPGVVVLTTRFELPTLAARHHAQILNLSSLDAESARGLLASLGVKGTDAELDRVAALAGHHAKAVELLGTFLVKYHGGEARQPVAMPTSPPLESGNPLEQSVARVLALFQQTLPAHLQDIIALATAFRDPPDEARLLQYLSSRPVQTLLHDTWGRTYLPFARRPPFEMQQFLRELVELRLLEKVGGPGRGIRLNPVIDAHPLVRRAFEHQLGTAGQRQTATARAGFLRGRPDRRRPETLEQASEEIEMFHAYCDAGLWNEADSVLVALDNPKHRWLAPVLERDLLLRFFPEGDWRQPPLWPGFGRYRSLAISFEMLGQFEDALAAYRDTDAPLRGDALIALGRLEPLLANLHAPHPWQTLWQAYRCHALCLAGRVSEAVALARSLVPVDVYEWLHVFECLLRAGRLDAVDLKSVLFRPMHATAHRWADLARRRMRADYLRLTGNPPADLDQEFRTILDAYDRAGLPYERALTRLSHASWLVQQGRDEEARSVARAAFALARQHSMPIVEVDACRLLEAELALSPTPPRP